jgi:hypothetical protein
MRQIFGSKKEQQKDGLNCIITIALFFCGHPEVSLRTLTATVLVQSHVKSHGFYGEENGIGAGFLEYNGFSC